MIDLPADLYNSYYESVEKHPVLMWQVCDFLYFEYEGHVYSIAALPYHSFNCPCESREVPEIPEMH